MENLKKENPDIGEETVVSNTAESLANLLTRPLKTEEERADALSRNDGKELVIDGEHIVLKAGASIELRCGESVIRMNRDGVIEIRGNYVISQASATQRLRGGSVHIN